MGRMTYGMADHLNMLRKEAMPEYCERRRLEIQAAEFAEADRDSAYPDITLENFRDADRHFKDRLNHYRRLYGVHVSDV